MMDPRAYGGKFLPQELDADPEARAAMHEAGLLFRSEAMRALYRVAIQVAGSDAPVLLTGESGTGKEIFARLLHTLSNRSGRPFVPVNCGVLSGELFADKFFGHEPGAFTGATRLQKGSFEMAADGTLFLDEVGEIPLPNQVDFLRVLEERTFKRLGGEKDLGFRARIVAATNRALPDMVRAGRFRPDLFYRLNVIPIALPSLRERSEDIAPLAEYFLWLFGHHYHRPNLSLSPSALALLTRHNWPGNVRELKNLMERVALLHKSDGPVMPGDLPLELRLEFGQNLPLGLDQGNAPSTAQETAHPDDLNLDVVVRRAETLAMMRAYKAAGGSKQRAAELLGISPRTLRHKLAQYGLKLEGE
ncbi:MAG: sigma-54 dependent transcriptional regulator [Humidesulfovibrio sp.]|uniref:sigma-54 interaction domain-containing protein n=2 Tax=Humidesulfovibrio sp. TaxID=2910988 RepID=UPI002734959A|nr:sigma-54 dependent transcriptional regulator [Humidesulfovibrio sp.]MDP2848213.1 sigma-54 dependent transcriptional regulator [Humidesulfovibrio sp.]